jgi:LysM repeat protein
MKLGAILFLLMLQNAFAGGPQEMLLQEMRLTLEGIEYKLHGQETELRLITERMRQLEKKETKSAPTFDHGLGKRVGELEEMQETLLQDLKKLKGQLQEVRTATAKYQKAIESMESLREDIKTVKASLSSMLTLLQGETKGGIYTVKPGDTLGEIAVKHHTDIKTVKQLNQITNDTIFPGQTLILPK